MAAADAAAKSIKSAEAEVTAAQQEIDAIMARRKNEQEKPAVDEAPEGGLLHELRNSRACCGVKCSVAGCVVSNRLGATSRRRIRSGHAAG